MCTYKPRAREGDAAAMAAINETYAKDPCLGARRMPDVLERRYGIKAGRKRVLRLKREMGLRNAGPPPAAIFSAIFPLRHSSKIAEKMV